MADMLRQSEENGNRLRSLETGMGQMRTDQEQRIAGARAAHCRGRSGSAGRRRAASRRARRRPLPGKPKPSSTPPKTSSTPPQDQRRRIRRGCAGSRRRRRCLQRGLPPVGSRPVRPGDQHAARVHCSLSQAPPGQLRQQPHRPRAARQGRRPRRGPGAARQLPQQPGRRARARQPVLSWARR